MGRANGLRPAWTTDVWTKRAKVMGKSAERDRRARGWAVSALLVGLILAIMVCLLFGPHTTTSKPEHGYLDYYGQSFGPEGNSLDSSFLGWMSKSTAFRQFRTGK